MAFRLVPLSSPHNPLVQDVCRAASSGRPTDEGLYVAEGPHLVEELQRSAWTIEKILCTPQALEHWEGTARGLGAETFVLSSKAFAHAAGTESPQGILALARPRVWEWAELCGSRPLLVALDGVQDPGNAGAIIRSAEAFGASGVVLLNGCARASNGKLLRASAGSVFRVPYRDAVDPVEFLRETRDAGIALFALAARARISLTEAALESPCVLIAGSEGEGVSPQLLAASTPLAIPSGAVESLNVTVAASIALYEASRRRSTA